MRREQLRGALLVGARHSHQVEVKSRLKPDQSKSSSRGVQANASPLRDQQSNRGGNYG